MMFYLHSGQVLWNTAIDQLLFRYDLELVDLNLHDLTGTLALVSQRAIRIKYLGLLLFEFDMVISYKKMDAYL